MSCFGSNDPECGVSEGKRRKTTRAVRSNKMKPKTPLDCETG